MNPSSDRTTVEHTKSSARLPRFGRRLLAVVVLVVVASAVLLGWWGRLVRDEAATGVCQEKLKRLALALSKYCHDHGTLPPAYVVGPNGKKMHSWRVLLLPYLEYDEFYRKYDLQEPWDSPHNLALARSHPEIAANFQCPSDTGVEHGWTSYVALVGPETLWPGLRTLSHSELLVGSSKILLVERKETGIFWTEPEDLSYDQAVDGLRALSPHRGFAHVVLPSGRVGSLGDCGLIFHTTEANNIREWAERYSGFPGKEALADLSIEQ